MQQHREASVRNMTYHTLNALIRQQTHNHVTIETIGIGCWCPLRPPYNRIGDVDECIVALWSDRIVHSQHSAWLTSLHVEQSKPDWALLADAETNPEPSSLMSSFLLSPQVARSSTDKIGAVEAKVGGAEPGTCLNGGKALVVGTRGNCIVNISRL